MSLNDNVSLFHSHVGENENWPLLRHKCRGLKESKCNLCFLTIASSDGGAKRQGVL